jgi:hypothetical protein
MAWLNSFKQPGVDRLAFAIQRSSGKCWKEFKKASNVESGRDSQEEWNIEVLAQYEFVFFFTHLAMRYAFSTLGDKRRTKLMNLLYPVLEQSTTDIWSGDWPDKLKEGVRSDFYHNINKAEMEYAECKGGLMIKDQPFSDDALFTKLAKHIAEISGHENNPATIAACIHVCVTEYCRMRLESLVDSIGEEL